MGIDQSFTSTAIVINDHGTIIDPIIISTTKDDDIFTRARQVSDAVIKVAQQYKPSSINIEGLAFASFGSATRDLAGLQMLLICDMRRNGYNPIIIAPNTLKKLATTKGNASKVDMHTCLPDDIKEQFKHIKKTKGLYDVVDAYWLSCIGETK